jgi:hypothetical protein
MKGRRYVDSQAHRSAIASPCTSTCGLTGLAPLSPALTHLQTSPSTHHQSPSNLTFNPHLHPHTQPLHSTRSILDVHLLVSPDKLYRHSWARHKHSHQWRLLRIVAVAQISHHAIIHQDLKRLHDSMLYFTYVEENVPYRESGRDQGKFGMFLPFHLLS